MLKVIAIIVGLFAHAGTLAGYFLSAAFTSVCELLQVTTLQLPKAALSCELIHVRCPFRSAYQKARIAEWTNVCCQQLVVAVCTQVAGPEGNSCVSIGFVLSQALSLSDIVDSVRVARHLPRQDECSRAKLVTC